MTVHTQMEAILLRLNLDVDFDTPYRYQKVDSLDFQELVMNCEQEFEILLLSEELAEINTINDLIALIDKKGKEKPVRW